MSTKASNQPVNCSCTPAFIWILSHVLAILWLLQISLPFQREFEEAKEGLIKLDKKYSEAVELIGSYVAEADEMKEQQEVMQLAAADREVEIGDLRGKLQEKEKEEEGGYKDKYETLYAMVEPFR